MIARSNGEVTFADLRIVPQAVVASGEAQQIRALPVRAWSQHVLGIHRSDRGEFEVEAVSDQLRRIQIVLLTHHHPFYQAETPGDAERRAFHEGVTSSDLGGQREFSWGQVLCRLEAKSNRDWLLIAYALGPQVPLQTSAVLGHLYAHEPEPHNE